MGCNSCIALSVSLNVVMANATASASLSFWFLSASCGLSILMSLTSGMAALCRFSNLPVSSPLGLPVALSTGGVCHVAL